MRSKVERNRSRVDQRIGFRLQSLIMKEEINYRKLHNTSTVDLLEGVHKNYRLKKRNSWIYMKLSSLFGSGELEVRYQAVWILTTLKLFLWHIVDLSFVFVGV